LRCPRIFAAEEATVKIGWTSLPEPRRLTPAEQAALDRLVAHAGSAGLTAQAASVQVVAVCDCGCPSVRLRSDAPAISGAEMRLMSSTGRDDWFSIDACTAGVRPVQVVVHVVQGTLHELEIFAGEGIRVEVPPPDQLTQTTLM
jgi:hypothetical protein